MTLPLPRIAMEILILLMERRGDLLTRQEIASRIWPGTDPEDVFQSINTAINRIRSTLRDEATSPKYVQTVIGKVTALSRLWKRRTWRRSFFRLPHP